MYGSKMKAMTGDFSWEGYKRGDKALDQDSVMRI